MEDFMQVSDDKSFFFFIFSYFLFCLERALICEFSPVTDFREARCRQFDQRECTRGGYCNFMHLYKIPHEVERRLFGRRTRRYSRSPPPRRETRRRDYDPYDRPSSSHSYRRYSRSPPPRREYHGSSSRHRDYREISPKMYRRSSHERSHSRERGRYSRDRNRSPPPAELYEAK